MLTNSPGYNATNPQTKFFALGCVLAIVGIVFLLLGLLFVLRVGMG